ncbi:MULTISPECIES: hypothetical protein [unclassified Novosphingobium]|uniref:hypothetical protein n=1 Tax=unclassified Novosphingobium TaxID=2644732 RepID=UPI00146E6D18|nr:MULTISPECIES: hypothetical protein [unclassified Novosphingobium]NMN86975.1 hypothetical protein [Novosphingobium sp. SG916]
MSCVKNGKQVFLHRHRRRELGGSFVLFRNTIALMLWQLCAVPGAGPAKAGVLTKISAQSANP